MHAVLVAVAAGHRGAGRGDKGQAGAASRPFLRCSFLVPLLLGSCGGASAGYQRVCVCVGGGSGSGGAGLG